MCYSVFPVIQLHAETSELMHIHHSNSPVKANKQLACVKCHQRVGVGAQPCVRAWCQRSESCFDSTTAETTKKEGGWPDVAGGGVCGDIPLSHCDSNIYEVEHLVFLKPLNVAANIIMEL